MIVVYIVLKKVTLVERLIGKGGVYVLRKFFGIILLAMAVKLFTTNLTSLLNSFSWLTIVIFPGRLSDNAPIFQWIDCKYIILPYLSIIVTAFIQTGNIPVFSKSNF